MPHTRQRSTLRLVQRADEEGVVGKLYYPDLVVLVPARHVQVAAFEQRAIFGVEAEVAAILLLHFGRAVYLADPGTLFEPDDAPRVHQRAGERRYEQHRSVGVLLGVVGFLDAEDVASVFDEGVLETAARAQERHAILTRVANGV